MHITHLTYTIKPCQHLKNSTCICGMYNNSNNYYYNTVT